LQDVVIVSTARTPIGRAYRGAFNNLTAPTMGAIPIREAVARSGIDPAEIEDVILGATLTEGTAFSNVARRASLTAGLPETTSGVTVSRACSSGLQAIAFAAQRIVMDKVPVMVAGGMDTVSLGRNEHTNTFMQVDPNLQAACPDAYYPMTRTAEIVAERYGISREAQDEYALTSQRRTAAGQENGFFDDEIVPVTATKLVTDKETGAVSEIETTLSKDEGNRPETSLQGLAMLKPVVKDTGTVTAGNASQLSDGASACVMMTAKEAERRGLEPLGYFRGLAVAGCRPDEMGIGPIFAVPRLLERFGLKMDDIDLWELNEAFAVQVIYCRDFLGIPMEILNVNGGSISIGHPFGMTGSRVAGHLLIEGRRRKAKYAISTMCIGAGMGAAGLFEIIR
jgi:acetyl-CoA C-acetyltransferase